MLNKTLTFDVSGVSSIISEVKGKINLCMFVFFTERTCVCIHVYLCYCREGGGGGVGAGCWESR